MSPEDRIREQLRNIYEGGAAERTWYQMEDLINKYEKTHLIARKLDQDKKIDLTQKDAILITYGDQLQDGNQSPLVCLENFLHSYLKDEISGVHILPFYPYSSDDGFSVIDYRKVDPDLGSWKEIQNIGKNFKLMFDAVINHVSRKSKWFLSFLREESPFDEFFIKVDPNIDLSMVFRPRALPLLTRADTQSSPVYVWTTFSDDQIDLNFGNPTVLLEITDLLLFYVSKGAELIRLDAIAYLWKEIGTTSIHLPQTHSVIKIWRAVLDILAPWVILITETNVPHIENISYFGEKNNEHAGTDEAQMVYQFPLAPLILHTIQKSDARKLTEWAQSLDAPGLFFNFIASHDGIGIMPAKDILSESEIEDIVDQTLTQGGKVSYKSNPDGSESVYELNITLYDWFNNNDYCPEKVSIDRFLASQAIMLSLAGVPGIYFHSLIGSKNCYKCMEETGRWRSINREKIEYSKLTEILSDPDSRQKKILDGYKKLLAVRSKNIAFHPKSSQRIINIDSNIFCLIRGEDTNKPVLGFVNVSANKKLLTMNMDEYNIPLKSETIDLLSNEIFSLKDGSMDMLLNPYQVRWVSTNN
jgi:sucrose phosphorylase